MINGIRSPRDTFWIEHCLFGFLRLNAMLRDVIKIGVIPVKQCCASDSVYAMVVTDDKRAAQRGAFYSTR